jgi:hypothetical protein
MNELTPGSWINQHASFDLRAWLSSSGRFNPLHLMAGPGSGKSRFLGRVLAWHDLVHGTPQIIVDPRGGAIQNLIDKLNRWAPEYERRFWERYKKPLPPEWVRYIDHVRQQLVNRIVYIDMNGQGSFPLYHRLSEDESLFDMSQRFVELIRRLDPALETASVEGFNALYKVGTYVGMILSALGLQITEAEDLLRHPQEWHGRFEQALAVDPYVRPAVEFFRDYIKRSDLRARRADSFLVKILAFAADPTMAAMFGSGTRSLNGDDVIKHKQTVGLDFSKVNIAERRRMLMLWICSEIFSYVKSRGSAGRAAPLAIIVDELSQILGYQQQGQSIMAADIEEWVSVIARQYGTWLTLAHQNLSQVDKRIQSALMEGNQMIGVIPNHHDAQEVAEHFFRYDPFWTKKKIPRYMAISSDPYYDPVDAMTIGGWETQLDHISTRTTPTIIDYTTEEFTIEEQLQLLKQQIQDLPQYHFLVRASGKEGQLAAPLRLLDISQVDVGIYPDEERVAETCRRLIKRSGFSKEEILAQIEQRALKPGKQKQSLKATNDKTRLNTTHDSTNNLPVTTKPTKPVPAPRKQSGKPRESDDESIFQ